ncbi:MAG: hypothetical protein ABI663_04425 [Chryseolinea sp.]
MKVIVISIAIVLSIQSFAQVNYIKKYSAAYNIGQDTGEAYSLKENGTCTWIYEWKNNGKLKTQKKYGTWTAREGYLRISVSGNTGIIIEEYILKNGRFVNKEDSNRYLVKTN